MKRWKRRVKCALALLVAAALAGSNVDGLLLSAVAEESVQNEGEQSEETLADISEEDSEVIAGQEDETVPGEEGIEEENTEEPSEEEEQEESLEEPSEEEEQGASSEEPSEEEEQEASSEEPSEDGEPEESSEEPSEDGEQEASSEEPSEDGEQEASSEEPSDEEAQQESAVESEDTQETVCEGTFVADVDLPDNDELFEGYVHRLFYGDSGISFYGNVGGTSLSGNEAVIYNALKEQVVKIAAGERPSASGIEISGVRFSGSNGEEVAEAVHAAVGKVYSYLLMDCPYELYWHDKSGAEGSGIGSSYYVNNNEVNTIILSLSVAKEYQGGDLSTVDTAKVGEAMAAADKAKEIVAKHRGKTEYDMLRAYLEEICSLVSYNTNAAEDPSTDYGNPWQLIWVFDGKPETNVVCEGYAKAFQYLCDMSGFNGCYTVTGTMNGGAHMWNIVTLEGMNYLVDVTNCDAGTVGSPDQLFLAGTGGSVEDGYTFTLNNGLHKIKYVYDSDQYGLLGQILNLAAVSYEDSNLLRVTVKVPEVNVIYGDRVENSALDGSSAQIADGTAVPGTFSWDSSVTTYGDAGRKTLKAVFTPEDVEKYRIVQDIPVTVTVQPKAVAAPTVKVEGTYSYTGEAVIPVLTVESKDCVLTANDYEVVFENNVNAGTAKLYVKPRSGGNYVWTSVEGTFNISKADYPYAGTEALSARYGTGMIFDLAALLPLGYVLGSLNVEDNDAVLQEAPVINGSVLSCRMSDDKTKAGKSAVVTIPVTESANYNPFELVLTITLLDKLEQADFRFIQSRMEMVYGDSDFVAEVVNAASGSTLSFTSSNENVALVDNTGKVRILNAGSAVITACASETDDYLQGTAVCTIEVAPKALGWDVSALYAVDKEGTVAEQKKASLYGELKVTGILEADRESVTFSCPANRLTGTYGDVVPGSQRVFLAWADAANPAVLQGARAFNYVLPAVLPECMGRINGVNGNLQPPAESTEQVQYSLSMEKGISRVPEAFAGMENLNTPAKIEAQMKLNIQNRAGGISQENIVVYDVALMVNVSGAGWQMAGKDNFPSDGLTVTIPYPEGTGKDANDFIVCHMFTQDGNGHKAGEVEYPSVTKTDAGIRFKVYGLSPVSVGWTKAGELNNAVEGNGNNDSSGGDRQNAAVQSPKTSDDNFVLLYLLSMIVSGGLLAGMIFIRKRKNSR